MDIDDVDILIFIEPVRVLHIGNTNTYTSYPPKSLFKCKLEKEKAGLILQCGKNEVHLEDFLREFE